MVNGTGVIQREVQNTIFYANLVMFGTHLMSFLGQLPCMVKTVQLNEFSIYKPTSMFKKCTRQRMLFAILN